VDDESRRTETKGDAALSKQSAIAPEGSTGKPVAYSGERWRRSWNSHRATITDTEKMGARRNLVNQLIIVTACLPIFLIH
jgi:hypothetical protein